MRGTLRSGTDTYRRHPISHSAWAASPTLGILHANSSVPAVVRAGFLAGRLLGVTTTDGDTFFPLFQFESDRGAVWVRPSLVPFLRRLRDRDPWTVGVLVLTAADELGGSTPVDWIREGGDEAELAEYAEILDAEFNRR